MGPKEVFLAFRGAARYRKALSRGDVSSQKTADARAAKCYRCPSRSSGERNVAGMVPYYCGSLGVETDDPKTCGCFVAYLTMDGQVLPGAKVWVASERCPQDRWGPQPL